MCFQITLLGEQHRPLVSPMVTPRASSAPAAIPPPSSFTAQNAYDGSIIPGANPGTVASVVIAQAPTSQTQEQTRESTPVSQSASQPTVSQGQGVMSQPADLSLNVSGFSGLGGGSLFGDFGTNPNTPNRDLVTPTPKDDGAKE